jgi:hypothetical protein
MKVMALCGNVKQARDHVGNGVDVVIAQGHEAGGHTGRIAGLVLIPAVIDAVSPVPVVAAGGVADGRGFVAALALGAVGVWLGTRFIATPEAYGHVNYKNKIVAIDEEGAREQGDVGRRRRPRPRRGGRGRPGSPHALRNSRTTRRNSSSRSWCSQWPARSMPTTVAWRKCSARPSSAGLPARLSLPYSKSVGQLIRDQRSWMSRPRISYGGHART